MAANLDVRDIQRMKDAGMTPLEPDHGVAAMTDLMAHGVTQAGVFELDWPLIFRQYSDPSKKTVLARFLDDSSASDSADFMKELLSASQDVRETMLIEKVSQIFGPRQAAGVRRQNPLRTAPHKRSCASWRWPGYFRRPVFT